MRIQGLREMVVQSKCRLGLWLLSFIIATLACSANAQSGLEDPARRKWLECDVDWISSEATVGPNFSVRVSFHGAPVAGPRISLRKDGKVGATERTNSQGIARFRAVSPGTYRTYSPDGLLFPSSSLEIEVKAGQTSAETVEIDWPDRFIAVRNPHGRFQVSEELDSPELPLRNASVELHDLRTGRLLESVFTDANGDYEFATKDSGIYALRLTLPKKGKADPDHRDLAIELDPVAKEGSIPEMKVAQSDCSGVQLFQRSQEDDTWEEH
jgi:protocatechuate 3,4-dioxygenase beta subunit